MPEQVATPTQFYVVTTRPRDRIWPGASEEEVRRTLTPQLKPGESIVAMRPALQIDIAYVAGQGGDRPQ